MAPRRRALLAFAAVTVAAGFDIDAHDAIGQTAASAMDQKAISGMKRLLGGKDASDVAGWGHQADDTFPGLARLHFQVHTGEWCGPPETRQAGHCEDNICLLTAIKHFYGKVLQDEGRKIEFPQIDYKKLEKDKQMKFTDADSVKMLINLIGDLHQPLHVGYASDDSGHGVKVKLRGKEMSLYDAWDKGISEIVRETESNFWYGGWTHIRAINAEFEKDKKLWKEFGPMASFDRWMAESIEFACKKAYVEPSSGKKIGGPDHKPGEIYEISDHSYQVWREAWLRQLLLAGERTAIVLNDILDAAGAAKLNQGTGVKTGVDEERAKESAEIEKARAERMKKEKKTSRGSKTIQPPWNFSNFLTNLGIAVVTVPTFLLVANYGMNPKTISALIMSLMEGGSKEGGGQGPPGKSAKRWE